MSYAAFKTTHRPTGIENCGGGFITHSPADFVPTLPAVQTDDLDSDWPDRRPADVGPVPNLVVTAGNVLEVYLVRVFEEADSKVVPRPEARRGGVVAGIAGASLELVCHYRLHGNVESMAILSLGGDGGQRRRDSIVLAFQDAKISVLDYDDSVHGLRVSSMHCYEGPDWQYLKRGRESFARGPLVKVDPLGRCGGVLVYGSQMMILKASQAGYGFVADDEANSQVGTLSAHFESSYAISLHDLDMKHVKDYIFVHGYIEPVMVVLYERELTWAGQVSSKHHTCSISAFSISTTLKQHPLIWSAANLPHDAYKLLAVPSPMGGILVVCANTIHYHSQSASCILGLNSFALPTDASQDLPRTNFSVELDAANATWLSNDVALLSTKTGELLLLHLVYDGRAVLRLELSRSKASVLTSCIATLGTSFFFLGSRLGDSMLVQYTSGLLKSTPSIHTKDEIADIEGEAPSAKRLRRASSEVSQDINNEELSLYTASNSSELTQMTFSFAVRDSLINVGPVKDFAYGLRINADSSAPGIAKQSNYELVCCSGHGKTGSLCVLQRSIRPELITEVELPGCKGIWTVYYKNSRSLSADSLKAMLEEDEYHAYLIISIESRTMVLETGELLGEVTETVDYYVQGSTIAAGNLFGRRRVVQVFARGARILDGSYMTQDLSLGAPNSELSSNSESIAVSSAYIADPYVLLRMSDGSIQLLVGDSATFTVSVSVPGVFDYTKETIASCTLYHDRGPEPWLRKTSPDAWLSTGLSAEAIDGTDGLQDQSDIYCLVCYDSGRLDIFEVPSFKCVYSVDKFVSGKAYIMDSLIKGPTLDHGEIKSSSGERYGQVKKESVTSVKVVELTMYRWSGPHTRPFLFGLLSDGTMFCYHAYVYEGQEIVPKSEEEIPLQVSHDLNSINSSRLRNLRFARITLESPMKEGHSVNSGPRMTIFNNIGGYQGLFFSGSKPAWLMLCRERFRVHPQLSDGSIVAFTVLHNVNCNHGLIYVTSQGLLKICQVPSAANYDNYWPVQKIPLKGTPHQVTYYAEKNLYPIIISFPVVKPLSQVVSSLVDQEVTHPYEQDNIISDDLQRTYTVDEFEVRILEPQKSGGPWEIKATIPMQGSENALTVRMVTLLNTTTMENETLMAIGTAYVQGEDVAARGRVLLYSIGKNGDESESLISEVYSKELKGAISALASLQGHLLIASGPKIILHKWTGSELTGVAFYDAPPLHAVSLNIVKNFILLGDIHKSIYFLNWKEQGAQLSLLAKDFGYLDCYATEFLIDGSTLSLVVSDDQKNVQIFYYKPKTHWKGQKLLSMAEFHAGVHITKFLRLPMLSVSPGSTTVSASDKSNRFALVFGTLDGSLGFIAPLDELTFRRLQTLQKKLVDAVPHVCGLNPKAYRQFRANGKAHRPGPDNIVDFELLEQYEFLSLEEQLEIAHQIGTTRSQILTNLNDLYLGTSFL